MRYLVGIDEAGRGALAGPVAVGAVLVAHDFDFAQVAGIKDSKQITPGGRERWFEALTELEHTGQLSFAAAFSSAKVIDTRGIVPAIRGAVSRALSRLNANPYTTEVRLDGSLHAPKRFAAQKTIIRGDESEPIISMASIAAKVMRDRLMIRTGKTHPVYGFALHKGYGTATHRAAIRTHGFCGLHRTTFCTRLFGVDSEPGACIAK